MEPERKTYWITKYLFTCGIEQKKLAVYSDPGYVHDDNWNLFRIGCDAHETKDAAIAHARKMIARKLASLDKQRDKLLKMEEELR
jgi:hypothetical protein